MQKGVSVRRVSGRSRWCWARAVPKSPESPAEASAAEAQESALTGPCAGNTAFQVGSGIYDITGPAAELGMMGYAMVDQKTAGIHQRLRSRAFVIASPCNGKRVAFVSADLGQVFQGVKQQVVERLQAALRRRLLGRQRAAERHAHPQRAGRLLALRALQPHHPRLRPAELRGDRGRHLPVDRPRPRQPRGRAPSASPRATCWTRASTAPPARTCATPPTERAQYALRHGQDDDAAAAADERTAPRWASSTGSPSTPRPWATTTCSSAATTRATPRTSSRRPRARTTRRRDVRGRLRPEQRGRRDAQHLRRTPTAAARTTSRARSSPAASSTRWRGRCTTARRSRSRAAWTTGTPT